MSIMEGRGGVPHVFRASIDTTGREHRLPFWSKYMRIRAATNPCKIYFTRKDYDDDANFITIPVAAAETPHGEWDGPIEAIMVWLRGLGGTSAIELVAIQRRG